MGLKQSEAKLFPKSIYLLNLSKKDVFFSCSLPCRNYRPHVVKRAPLHFIQSKKCTQHE